MVRGFRELIAWQKAMELVKIVYRLMRGFPAEERFRLCDQLSRAVISIPSNIAEGNGRESKTEYARFLGIARGSLYETETQLRLPSNLVTSMIFQKSSNSLQKLPACSFPSFPN